MGGTRQIAIRKSMNWKEVKIMEEEGGQKKTNNAIQNIPVQRNN
jgi:hypothetical protein